MRTSALVLVIGLASTGCRQVQGGASLLNGETAAGTTVANISGVAIMKQLDANEVLFAPVSGNLTGNMPTRGQGTPPHSNDCSFALLLGDAFPPRFVGFLPQPGLFLNGTVEVAKSRHRLRFTVAEATLVAVSLRALGVDYEDTDRIWFEGPGGATGEFVLARETDEERLSLPPAMLAPGIWDLVLETGQDPSGPDVDDVLFADVHLTGNHAVTGVGVVVPSL